MAREIFSPDSRERLADPRSLDFNFLKAPHRSSVSPIVVVFQEPWCRFPTFRKNVRVQRPGIDRAPAGNFHTRSPRKVLPTPEVRRIGDFSNFCGKLVHPIPAKNFFDPRCRGISGFFEFLMEILHRITAKVFADPQVEVHRRFSPRLLENSHRRYTSEIIGHVCPGKGRVCWN